MSEFKWKIGVLEMSIGNDKSVNNSSVRYTGEANLMSCFKMKSMTSDICLSQLPACKTAEERTWLFQ